MITEGERAFFEESVMRLKPGETIECACLQEEVMETYIAFDQARLKLDSPVIIQMLESSVRVTMPSESPLLLFRAIAYALALTALLVIPAVILWRFIR